MILIISNNDDFSTDLVIEYLTYYKKSYIRINSNDKVTVEYLGSEIFFQVNKASFYLSEIKSIWYRRGYLNFKFNDYINIKQLSDLQLLELKKLNQYIYYNFNKIKHLNKIEDIEINKLIVNDIAKKIGLKVPNDYLFSSKKSIEENFTLNEKKITKLISGHSMLHFDKFTTYNYTKFITNIFHLTDNFFPTLVQDYIEKKYELRIFYLDGIFYTMAIMSQSDEKTKIDFRNYNNSKPNRTVPYKLPKVIEQKLKKLMKKLNLNSGSIDMIVTKKLEFYFLEVNPNGQFGMISYPCNYNLEEKIANYLIDYEN